MIPFNTVSIIKKKREGQALSREEIEYFVEGFTEGKIPDYQMSAFLMATLFRGMNEKEMAVLVEVMLRSGEIVDLSKIKKVKVDKHSTGGIGDKTTLILAPLLAAVGFAYPTLAGRGLAHTGGTVDKLESIPGFRCDISLQRFQELIGSVGLAFMGQTEQICPADRKIYALRDVTATVESLPLIVASIMSKKFAEGMDAIVFDIKCGSGAFMKNKTEAETLAKALVKTAKQGGKKAKALVTDMSQPLGHAVGNAIEVNECVSFLRRGPADPKPSAILHSVTMTLATELYLLGSEKKITPKQAREDLEEALESGRAYGKFLEIVSLQGGDTHAMDEGLPLAPVQVDFLATKAGKISSMDGETIGFALVELKGGRKIASDQIHPGVGFWFEKFLGDSVRKGERIAQVYAASKKEAETALESLQKAVVLGSKGKKPNLILKRI